MEAYWEDTAPVVSPDGATVAFGDGGYVWTVAGRRQHAGRAASCAPAPRSGSTTRRLLGVVGREGSSHLVVFDLANPWPQSIAHGDGDCGRRGRLARPRRSVAYTFWPHDDRNRSEIRVLDLDDRRARARSPAPTAMQDKGPAWSPDGATIAYVSERSGWYEIHLVDASERRRPPAHPRRSGLRRARVAPRRRSASSPPAPGAATATS